VQIENELLACDLKMVLGMVTPHFASGFAGGPDIVLPGSSSLESIAKNRSLMIKGIPGPGDIKENLVLSDVLEACKMAGTFYSLSFIPDGSEGIDSVFSGELEAVFRETVARYLQIHSPKVDRKSDVVVLAAGKILGMDLYHGVRVLSNAFGAVKRHRKPGISGVLSPILGKERSCHRDESQIQARKPCLTLPPRGT